MPAISVTEPVALAVMFFIFFFGFAVINALLLTGLILSPLIPFSSIDFEKVHRLAAGVVLAAVLQPFAGMTRRYVQVRKFCCACKGW